MKIQAKESAPHHHSSSSQFPSVFFLHGHLCLANRLQFKAVKCNCQCSYGRNRNQRNDRRDAKTVSTRRKLAVAGEGDKSLCRQTARSPNE